MTITTLGTAAAITPTAIKTFFRHYYEQARKSKEDRHTEATDEILFHEAFEIVRKFCAVGTQDTVESLQAFTNTHVPSPPWATVIGVLVPLASCDDAAKVLIDYFGPDELKRVVGGEKWWQVRGLAGIEAEWIAQTSDWKLGKDLEKQMANEKKKESKEAEMQAAAKKARETAKRSAVQRHNAAISERQGKWKDQTVGKVVRIVREKTGQTEEISADADAKNTELKGEEQRQDQSAVWEEMDLEEEEQNEDAFTSFENLDRLKRVMLYLHGGAGYWGSINTHRYQIIRFARKFGGRAFAVNYRKAPNYPWPCPIQDVLAGYLYLIRPPPGAKHKPVDPAHLVLAGDSFGGGICLALLTVLRDMNLPLPAGAVLISPWCDMTHSFPSITQNTDTDIIPVYGFIHKPSTLWPVPGTDPALEEQNDVEGGTRSNGAPPQQSESKADPSIPPPPKYLYSKVIEVPIDDPKHQETWGKQMHLKGQIQQYATNDQLTHPLCSPLLHGSLGGLPPLYILAGNSEVLRDEIVYLAHRAARPTQYPLSDHLLQASARVREQQERFDSQPTKVHFQLFDEMCHVLTVFAFTTEAKFAYRAVASFVKHVTGAPTAIIDPFPQITNKQRIEENPSLNTTHSTLSTGGITKPEEQESQKGKGSLAPLQLTGLQQEEGNTMTDSPRTTTNPHTPVTPMQPSNNPADVDAEDKNLTPKQLEHKRKAARQADRRKAVAQGSVNEYSGTVPLLRPSFHEYMIRERVDTRGKIRPMEPESEMQALQMQPEEIGKIKEGPAVRYMTGQAIWAKKFRKEYKRVTKRKAANMAKAEDILRKAAQKGLLSQGRGAAAPYDSGSKAHWTSEARFGPTDILDETPPPSAIAGRRDTEDALALLRTSLRIRANQVKTNGKEDSTGAPQQSAAEKQRTGHGMDGIAIWSNLMSHLYRKQRPRDPTSGVVKRGGDEEEDGWGTDNNASPASPA